MGRAYTRFARAGVAQGYDFGDVVPWLGHDDGRGGV